MGALSRRAFVVLALASACSGAPVRPEPARVRFQIEPETARIYVEDRFVGAARVLSRRPATFNPGLRYFTITADGYFPHDLEMDLPSGETTVRVRLRALPP